MNKTQKSIGLNAILNGLKTILSVIFPLITYPYAARVLQVENIGKVNFSNSVVSYFVLLAGLGIATYAIREGAGLRDSKEDLERFSSEIFSINALSSIISLILLTFVVIAVPKFQSFSLLIAVQSVAIVGNLVGVTWLYSIEEDYAYITIRSLIVHVAALILLFVFVRDQSDYVLYAATTVVANAGANVFNYFHAKKYVRIRLTKKLNLKKHMKPIMVIFASAVTTTIYVNSDKTILGFLSDDYHVGLYSTSVNVYTVLKSCIAAIILVALPRLSNYLAAGKREEYEKTATDIFKMFMVILLPVMIGIFLTAEDVISIIGGENYLEAAVSLKILSISLMFSMIATYYTNAVLLPMKQEKVVLNGTLLSAVVNISLNFILIGTYKQNGAAFTTLLAEMLICGYQYLYVRKLLKVNVSARYVLSLIAGCASIVAVVFVCNRLIHTFVINVVLKIAFSVICYAGVLLAFKNDTALSIIAGIRTKNK